MIINVSRVVVATLLTGICLASPASATNPNCPPVTDVAIASVGSNWVLSWSLSDTSDVDVIIPFIRVASYQTWYNNGTGLYPSVLSSTATEFTLSKAYVSNLIATETLTSVILSIRVDNNLVNCSTLVDFASTDGVNLNTTPTINFSRVSNTEVKINFDESTYSTLDSVKFIKLSDRSVQTFNNVGNDFIFTNLTGSASYTIYIENQNPINGLYKISNSFTLQYISPAPTPSQLAALAAAREAEARKYLTTYDASSPSLTISNFVEAGFSGVNAGNITGINTSLAELSKTKTLDILDITKIVAHFVAIDQIASNYSAYPSQQLITLGLIAKGDRLTSSYIRSLRLLPENEKNSLDKIQLVIDAVKKNDQIRKTHLSGTISKIRERK